MQSQREILSERYARSEFPNENIAVPIVGLTHLCLNQYLECQPSKD